MGRKRGTAAKAAPEHPVDVSMDGVFERSIRPRMSVLQVMCAAAVPVETVDGRQISRETQESQFQAGNIGQGTTVASQFQAGIMGQGNAVDVHASSLLRSGHFVMVNNELAKSRRHRETFNQLPSGKNKEITNASSYVGQGHAGEGEKRPPSPAKAEKSKPEPVRAESNDGNGAGKGVGACKPRSGMKGAIKLAKASNDLRRAKEAFRKKFLAQGTLLARNAKRKKIKELLDILCGEDHFPATQELILGVATALDEAQLQSGDQYIHELKLMHIESGHEWSSPLERQLFLCKKALRRHRGPEIRAKEFQIADISEEVWLQKFSKKGQYVRPAWFYAMAVLWMLRACEATELRMGDVEVDCDKREVAITVRKSKTDQAAKGMKRTLVCCGRQSCKRECPFALAVMALAERPNGKEADHLFAVKGRSKRDRAHTAKCWAETLNRGITGHSARRSGAMFYTRKGMDVQDISFLGRWRSSAVFRYMEEAMQEKPMNAKLKEPKEDEVKLSVVNHTQAMENWSASLSGEATRAPSTPAPGTPAPRTPAPGTPNPVKLPENPEDSELWATSWGRSRKKVVHWVTKASWQSDLNQWATACGWHFAQRAVKVTLSKIPPANTPKCIKCERLKELRDKSPGGVGLAQIVSVELDAVLQKESKQDIVQV